MLVSDCYYTISQSDHRKKMLVRVNGIKKALNYFSSIET